MKLAIAVALLVAFPLASAGLPRVFEGGFRPSYESLPVHEHNELCVVKEPDEVPEGTNVAAYQHCPTIPGSLVGEFAGLDLQTRETRVLRVLVDRDFAFDDAIRPHADPRAKREEWIAKAASVFLDDAGLRFEVVYENYQPAQANYTALAGRVHYNDYLAAADAHWAGRLDYDILLVLTGNHVGPPGIGKIGTAGHPNLVNAAYVQVTSFTPPPCAINRASCTGPIDTWMPTAILHEVSHTLSNRHEYGDCGVQDGDAGCTIMLGMQARPELRIMEFSEREELAIRGHAETHLSADPHEPGLIPLN